MSVKRVTKLVQSVTTCAQRVIMFVQRVTMFARREIMFVQRVTNGLTGQVVLSRPDLWTWSTFPRRQELWGQKHHLFTKVGVGRMVDG